MTAPPSPADEAARLAALKRYQILDTEREREYDDIVLIAAQICGTPMALISWRAVIGRGHLDHGMLT